VITRHEKMWSRLALVHALLFAGVCAVPRACQQHEYVLWGGVHIMPPLLTQWMAICVLCVRHRLHLRPGARHALCVAALSGVWFWLGNSAIIFGRDRGLPRWIRSFVEHVFALKQPIPSVYWEEMAVFHVFGVAGNEWLFRGYEWIALMEQAHAARTATPLTSEVSTPTSSPPRSPASSSPSTPRVSKEECGHAAAAVRKHAPLPSTEDAHAPLQATAEPSHVVCTEAAVRSEAWCDTWLAQLLENDEFTTARGVAPDRKQKMG